MAILLLQLMCVHVCPGLFEQSASGASKAVIASRIQQRVRELRVGQYWVCREGLGNSCALASSQYLDCHQRMSAVALKTMITGMAASAASGMLQHA
jgi:hypothetical protein